MHNIIDELLSEEEAGLKIGKSKSWLQKTRTRAFNGIAPRPTRIGRSIYYHPDDLEKFLNQCRTGQATLL